MSKKPTKLHELLAVIGDRANMAKHVLDETGNTFTKKADHFMGQTRSVTFVDENRAGENTSDTKQVVDTVHSKLDYTFKQIGKHWDALLQLEEANSNAMADLVVDGAVLMENVPATFLLGMETRLKSLREVMLVMPTLNPAMVWSPDESAGDHRWKTDAVQSHRTEKQLRHKVLYEATKEHPAQIEKWYEDRVIANIETVHFSGMPTPAQKSVMLSRVDKLISAVKKARQRANGAEVKDIKIAAAMFDYILAAE